MQEKEHRIADSLVSFVLKAVATLVFIRIWTVAYVAACEEGIISTSGKEVLFLMWFNNLALRCYQFFLAIGILYAIAFCLHGLYLFFCNYKRDYPECTVKK